MSDVTQRSIPGSRNTGLWPSFGSHPCAVCEAFRSSSPVLGFSWRSASEACLPVPPPRLTSIDRFPTNKTEQQLDKRDSCCQVACPTKLSTLPSTYISSRRGFSSGRGGFFYFPVSSSCALCASHSPGVLAPASHLSYLDFFCVFPTLTLIQAMLEEPPKLPAANRLKSRSGASVPADLAAGSSRDLGTSNPGSQSQSQSPSRASASAGRVRGNGSANDLPPDVEFEKIVTPKTGSNNTAVDTRGENNQGSAVRNGGREKGAGRTGGSTPFASPAGSDRNVLEMLDDKVRTSIVRDSNFLVASRPTSFASCHIYNSLRKCPRRLANSICADFRSAFVVPLKAVAAKIITVLYVFQVVWSLNGQWPNNATIGSHRHR